MYFTDDQLSNEPELRPRIWKSETTFERERLFLLKRLASILHASVDGPASTLSTTSVISSSSTSLASPTSTIVTFDSDKTTRSNSSIFSSITASSVATTPRSVSSFFSLPFGSTSRTSIASSASGLVPHTPIIFNSPQTSTFSFETANPSPLKVDSVMGSPIRLRSASMFKRKNKKTEKKGAEDDGSTTGVVVKEGRVSQFFKTAVAKNSINGSKENVADGDKITDSEDFDDNETVKDFDRVESDGSLDGKGKEYVVERLGLGIFAEPQPLEHQYSFVKKQIEKAREKFVSRKGVKNSL